MKRRAEGRRFISLDCHFSFLRFRLRQRIEEFDRLAVLGELNDRLFIGRSIALARAHSALFPFYVDRVHAFDLYAEKLFDRQLDFRLIRGLFHHERIFLD